MGKEGTGRVELSRRLLNAVLIALTGLGSLVSKGSLMEVGMLGVIFKVLITMGSNGCKPTISNDFLMFSIVNALINGCSIAWRKACLFIAPKPSQA